MAALIKNKAFFYFNYEGLRQDLRETLINFVPNDALRNLALATSPALRPILSAYPTGGGSGTVVGSVRGQRSDLRLHEPGHRRSYRYGAGRCGDGAIRLPLHRPYYSPNTHDFAPRLGLAWAPDAHTSIRSGFGIYYGSNQNDDFSDLAESAVPRYSLASSDFSALAYPLVAFLDPTNQLYSPKAIARNRKDLSYNEWDFVVQRELAKDFVAQVGYTGSEGHHPFDKYTVNLINPLTGKRPLAAFGSFGLKANDGNDNFNSLQASLRRRFARGFLLQANYMWSHGITAASVGSGESVTFQDMGCRACDRSSTNIDVRHTFTTNGV